VAQSVVPPTSGKRVLYFGGDPAQFADLVKTLAVASQNRHGPAADSGLARLARAAPAGAPKVAWLAEVSPEAVIKRLEADFVNLVVLDLRCAGGREQFQQLRAEILAILSALDDVPDIEFRYGFHRILLLISAPDSEVVDQTILEVGKRGVGSVLRQSLSSTGGEYCATNEAFARRVAAQVEEMIFAPHHKKRALCAAGGGVTGIHFEVGTLKCLDDCLSDNALNSFDLYFGISAGAIVNGVLAAGYSIDELMASICGVSGLRIAPIDMRVFTLAHLDYPGFARHLRIAARTAWRAFWHSLRHPGLPSLDSLLFDYADVVGPLFRAHGFGQALEEVMTSAGATNDFRELPHGLFIGATDQDRRQHVLFGSEDADDVPISVAIQASMSINPAFSATAIGKHYYEDGAVTRTSNFGEAIRRGADLILTVDPFVPYVSRQAGFSNARGMLYNIDQNVRAMSYTRFENTRNWVLRRHPDVSSYTFIPRNHLRRLLSVSPFDHRPYLEIWRGAYLSTVQRLERIGHRLRGDLKRHHIKLDTSRAEAVAGQLRAAKEPQLEDFFIDRKLDIKQPPLCMEPTHPSRAKSPPARAARA
jgi:NTE family protein